MNSAHSFLHPIDVATHYASYQVYGQIPLHGRRVLIVPPGVVVGDGAVGKVRYVACAIVHVLMPL